MGKEGTERGGFEGLGIGGFEMEDNERQVVAQRLGRFSFFDRAMGENNPGSKSKGTEVP
jgi:hypothetical protein